MAYLPGFKIETRIVGVTFDNRQEIVKNLHSGEKVQLVREPSNPHDGNAIRVERLSGEQFGYIKEELAVQLAATLDQNGEPVEAVVNEVLGGGRSCPNYGVSIEFTVPEKGSIPGTAVNAPGQNTFAELIIPLEYYLPDEWFYTGNREQVFPMLANIAGNYCENPPHWVTTTRPPVDTDEDFDVDQDSCYEDEVWGDVDWADHLGCDVEDVDRFFESQMC